ncbi:MAG TPA: trypsin-like peptidase domain-containing protein [Trebonia sp.]|jgi:V8-like Glu-specific endopeptidase|nr:trypsin-like peptidase domain-containing protein [Trebonia sp.]
MKITLSSRIVALTAVLAFAGAQAMLPQAATAAAGARPSPAAASRPPARARLAAVSRPVAGARAGWLTGDTAGRGLRLVHGGAVDAAVGKVFFTLGDTDYTCSGTLVRGNGGYVVVTAAHCVTNGRGQWAVNWTFVPGYKDGTEPYGRYTARRFFVSPRWQGPAASERYDVAFVRVSPAPRHGRESRPARPPAGLPISFAASQTAARQAQAYVFGYPALPPYTGLYLNYCAGPAASSATRKGSARLACAMTAGDSGGPWLTGFSPRADAGTITAVTAYKLSGDKRTLYGTVLGPNARALYLRASA